MPQIHPTAVIDPAVELADDVVVGPYAVLDGPVRVGAGTRIGPHTQLIGPLALGQGNRVHAGCVLGDAPQHTGYKGEPTRTEIGDFNTFREHVTVHRGMPAAAGVTRIGSHNLFMVNSHVAHDCHVGSHCTLANGSLLAGHVTLMDRAILSGNSAVGQHCRVGRLAFLGGTAGVSQDLPPFWIAQGGINVVRGVNVIGMRRAGVTHDEIQAVRFAFRVLNKSGLPVPAALEEIEAKHGTLPAVRELIDFIRASTRGIAVGKGAAADDDD